jgi:hypothetical protein
MMGNIPYRRVKIGVLRPSRRENHGDRPAFALRHNGTRVATTFNDTNESQEAQREKPSPKTGAFQP